MAKISRLNSVPLFEPLEGRTLMSTYYVSPFGNDANSGASTTAAWKSISKVNSASLKPGDEVLFQGGQSFSGTIKLKNGGSSTSAITLASYGSGRATISSGKGEGLYSLSKSGIWINNLKFQGTPTGDGHNGLRFETNNGNQSNIRVTNSEISGYGWNGVLVMGDRNGIGFSNVQITNNSIHHNIDNGIAFFAVSRNVHKNVYIARNDVYGMYGDGNSICTGSGMMLGAMNGAVVEWNTAHDNGGKGGNGNVGIWAYESTGVTLQYNVSHSNRTTRGMDGDGFDFDADTSNSIMQYNYSYNNDGAGYMLCHWRSNSNFTNNTIRYNVSQNDGRKNTYGSIAVFGQVMNSSIYNNAVYLSGGANTVGVRIKRSALGGGSPTNLRILNNIIQTAGGKGLINVASNTTSGVTFQGNTYWSSGSSSSFVFGNSYSSLSAWQSATGQEKLNGQSVGLQTDPKLNAAGAGAALTDAAHLGQLSAYKLQSTSPLINRGVNINSLLGATIGKDFFGAPLPQGGAFEVGINEVGILGTPPLPPPTGTKPPPVNDDDDDTGSAALPTGWSAQDIGSVGKTGSTSYANGTFTVSGSGSDIYGYDDSLQYASKTLNGDGEIVARIDSLSGGDAWAKAGIMIRDGSSSNAAEVSMLVTPSNGATFERRWNDHSYTGSTSTDAAAPEWVRLVRRGDYFSGYTSEDGASWDLVYTTRVYMSSNVSVGLAVTAHDNDSLETARFSNVSVIA